MDINGFRVPQSPWFFTQPPTTLVDIRNSETTERQTKSLPTQDNRYPGWAAPMNDGRLVTDYRSRCEVKIPAGSQFATRLFMQRNADSIMNQSRKRQVINTGAGLSYDGTTEMPAAEYIKCNTAECKIRSVASAQGVGTVRLEGVPPLFGTFSAKSPSILNPAKHTLTQFQEGGRNSVRGSFGRKPTQ
jgi:hypothetical protein